MRPEQSIKHSYSLLFFIFIVSACGYHSDTRRASHKQSIYSSKPPSQPSYICNNPQSLKGKVVGDGHCVSLIKHCTNIPNTIEWRPGKQVWKNEIAAGSIIATFKNNRYPNVTGHHAAIYIKQDSDGIWVWDQWQGTAVHKRLIRWRDDNAAAANTAQAYRLVISQ